MEALAARLGISDLQFLGRLSAMESFYAGIDLLLHPALREPYGNVCAEALLAGVPVVATAVDGLPEVIEQGIDGLCVDPTLTLADYREFGGDPGGVHPRVWRPDLHRVAEPGVPDPGRLADAVISIATDSRRYAQFSAAAVRLGAQRFDYGAHVDHLLEQLKHACATFRQRRQAPGKAYNCDEQTRPA